jgi:hypothetical protein
MGKVEDVTGRELSPGDYVTVQGWCGLEVAKVRRFSESCMICDVESINSIGDRYVGRVQPYLPNHPNTSSSKKHPNRMLRVLKITKEQYDHHIQNL